MSADADDEDDDRLVLAKSDDIPLELLEEPAKASSGPLVPLRRRRPKKRSGSKRR